jgi:hypothetical protein
MILSASGVKERLEIELVYRMAFDTFGLIPTSFLNSQENYGRFSNPSWYAISEILRPSTAFTPTS